MRTRRDRAVAARTAQTEQLVERIASERIEALEKAVDFSPIVGAPASVVRLVLPDARPLLAKHPSQWGDDEIARLQESIDKLPLRMLVVVRSEIIVI